VAIHERARLHFGDVLRAARLGGAGRENRSSESGNRGGPHRDPHLVDFVLIGIVPPRVEPLVPDAPVEHLQRERVTVGAVQRKRLGPAAVARGASSRRTDEDVTTEKRAVDEHDPVARPRRGVPQGERGRLRHALLAGTIGIVADEIERGAAHDFVGVGLHRLEPDGRFARHAVARRPADRVVKLALHQFPPRLFQHRPVVAPIAAARQRGERLGRPDDPHLELRHAPLEWSPRSVHALQRPGVARREAQRTGQDRRVPELPRRRDEEFVQPGDANAVGPLQLAELLVQARDLEWSGVMIGPDEHRDLPAGSAGDQLPAHPRPRLLHRSAVRSQLDADVVARRRQMPQPHFRATGAPPAIAIAVLARSAAQPAPHDRRIDSRPSRQLGQPLGVTKRVRRIQHAEAPTPRRRIGGAEQQIAHQRLARRDLLVRQDVPRPDLQPPGAHQGLDLLDTLGPCAGIVLEEDRLAVEEETRKSRIAAQPIEQLVQRCDQPCVQGGPREMPLAVPVGVQNQMKGEGRHQPTAAASWSTSSGRDRCT
jgi:hypothetical protein